MSNMRVATGLLSWKRLAWRVGLVPLALTLVCGVLAGVTDLPAGGGDASGAVPAVGESQPCADVLVVGADGAGEVPEPKLTFGRTVETFYREYVERAAGSPWRVAGVRIPVSTLPTATIKTTPTATGRAVRVVTRDSVKRWREGLSEGVRSAVSYLREQAVTCPDQQLVVVGYSQGASVMHRALSRLRDEPAIITRLSAVALIGDSERASGSRALLKGAPAAPREGAGAAWLRVDRIADLPRTGWAMPVWQICTQGDVVCDLRRTPIARAIRRHDGYWHDEAADTVKSVARRVWAHTQRHPKPAVDPFAVTADTTTPVRVRLPVDVAPSALDYVRWHPQAALPPGLLLDSRGVLSGTPTTPGSWQVPYTVSSVESAEYAHGVAGTLEVTVRTGETGTVSSGGGQSCAVRADTTLWCWGRNDYGQLGNGTTTRSDVPVRVGTESGWGSVTTNGSTSCAVRTDHSLWCWGLNFRGQLGIGTTDKRLRPARVGTGLSWATVSNSWFHTCATRLDGSLWCWGENRNGQLGDGTTNRRTSPVRVGSDTDWASVTAGGWHTCATKRNGSLWCWGDNAFGQLGTGNTRATRTPVRVGTGTSWTSVSANWGHSCALKTDGSVHCWGRNTDGQLGDGSVKNRKSPTTVAGSRIFTGVTAGDASTCAVASDGALWCWGGNSYGQLGDSTRTARRTPVQVLTAQPVVTASAGWVHACAVQTDASTVCWGSNEDGQLGAGSFTDAASPVTVR